MCIYYGNETELTYEKQEHVFPAGLGGIAMLPKGFVSDQANELFSPWEAQLMHNSLIGMERALLGPGKRGSHSPGKASASHIAVIKNTDGKLALGYFSGKHGYYINSLYKKNDELIFTVASDRHDDPAAAWNSFQDDVKAFRTRFVGISAPQLDPNDWIFGAYKGKYYLALGSQCQPAAVTKQLQLISDAAKPGGSSGYAECLCYFPV